MAESNDAAAATERVFATAFSGAEDSLVGFAGGSLFGQFHEGGGAGERAPAVRYFDLGIFAHAPRYHGGGFAGSGLLSDEVPIIARRGELIVPPERVVREEKTAREHRPITVGVNVTAAELLSGEPGPDRGGHRARHLPGRSEPLGAFTSAAPWPP